MAVPVQNDCVVSNARLKAAHTRDLFDSERSRAQQAASMVAMKPLAIETPRPVADSAGFVSPQ